MTPRVEITAGDVAVLVDAPRVALATVHRVAVEALASAAAELARTPPKRPRVGFAVDTAGPDEPDCPTPINAS